MSGTLTVKQLIKELLNHNMNDNVYILLEDSQINIDCIYTRHEVDRVKRGSYINASNTLIEAPEEK